MIRTLLLLPLLLSCPPVQAHLFKVFAYAEGAQIHGSAYFSGGRQAAGARITVSTADGRVLASLRSDDKGEFAFQTDTRADHLIVADSGDGHVAKWTVTTAELGSDLPAAKEVSTLRHPLSATGVREPMNAPSGIFNDQLTALVERAVARQVGPLRAEVQRYAEHVRLGDILGGIGFIFGLAGLALWWRSRSTKSRT
jgi:nickel transport protein